MATRPVNYNQLRPDIQRKIDIAQHRTAPTTVISQRTGEEAPRSFKDGQLSPEERQKLKNEQAGGTSKVAIVRSVYSQQNKVKPIQTEDSGSGGIQTQSKLEQTRTLITQEKHDWAKRMHDAPSGSNEQRIAQAEYRKYKDLERQFQGKKELSSEGERYFLLSQENSEEMLNKPKLERYPADKYNPQQNISQLKENIKSGNVRAVAGQVGDVFTPDFSKFPQIAGWRENKSTLYVELDKSKIRQFLAGENARDYARNYYNKQAQSQIDTFSTKLQGRINKGELNYESAVALQGARQKEIQSDLNAQFERLNKQSTASSEKVSKENVLGIGWEVPTMAEVFSSPLTESKMWRKGVTPFMGEYTKTGLGQLSELNANVSSSNAPIQVKKYVSGFKNVGGGGLKYTERIITKEPIIPIAIAGAGFGVGTLLGATAGFGASAKTLSTISGISMGAYGGFKVVDYAIAQKTRRGIPRNIANEEILGYKLAQAMWEIGPAIAGGYAGYKLGTGIRTQYYKPRLASEKIWSGKQINQQVRSLQTGKSTVRASEVTRTTETQNPFSRVEESQFKGVSEDAYYILVKSGGKTMLQKIAGGNELRMLDPQLKSIVASGKYDITINYPKGLKIPEQQGFGLSLEERVPTGMNTMTRYGKADFFFKAVKGKGWDVTSLKYEGKLTSTPSQESELTGTFFEFGKVKSSSLLNKNVDLNNYATKFYGDLSNPKIGYIKGNKYNFETLTSGKYFIELRNPSPVVTSIQKGDFLQTNTFKLQQTLLDVKYHGVQYAVSGEGIRTVDTSAVKGSNLLRLFNMNKRANVFVTDASLRGADLTGVRDLTGLGITGYKSNINLDLIMPKPQVIAPSVPNVNTLIDSRVVGFGITRQMALSISQSQIGFTPMLFPVSMGRINAGLKSVPTVKVSSIFGPSLKTIQLTKQGTVPDFAPATQIQTITQVIPQPPIPPVPPIPPLPVVQPMGFGFGFPPGFKLGGESSEKYKNPYGYLYSLKSRFVGNLLPIFVKGTIPLPKAKKFKAMSFKLPKAMKQKKTKWRF